jgi:hypothetical protein
LVEGLALAWSDVHQLPVDSAKRPLCFACSPVFTQRIRRRRLKRHAIRFVAQLLEIAEERLQPASVTAVGGHDPVRIGV